ncbi:Ankyrin repeat-containing protein [Spatholobus suberectus]|nr:Ankyrin repeat-containing protein [Spatholobus suberectus]
MNPESGNGDQELPYVTSEEVPDYLAEYTLEGKWENVIEMYYEIPWAHTAMVNESVGTALHVAIDLDEERVVRELVNAIITHRVPPAGPTAERQRVKIKALETKNERGDTPLHVAASRGFARLCKWIIGMNNERIYLASLRNKQGETPLFQAAINWKKQAFAYLSHISRHSAPLQDLVRDNGDTILHCAIRREYFDLAVIIVHYYDFLSTHTNKEGFTPLKVLATRPSAFRSASKLLWWKRILYHCILVEPLDAERQMKANLVKMEKQPKSDKENYPKNYATLFDFVALSSSVAALIGKMPPTNNQHDTENPSINKQSTITFGTPKVGFLPPNYETFQQFVRSAYVHTLGLSGVELKEVKKTKKRHQWSGQLLQALMKMPYAAFTGSGGVPTDIEVEAAMYNVYSQYKQGETSSLEWLEEETELKADEKKPSSRSDTRKETDQLADEKSIDKKETAFLVAARNGIVEMVNEILNRIPSVIHNTNSKKENVLLVAVMNRQPLVVESLKMQSKPEVWSNLILAVDDDENTMLHLAAYGPRSDKPWQIAGSALQMMWDIKWFQYIKSLVPQHFYFRSGKEAKTAGEIFEETHKDLIKDGSEWLKDTSESCSVVAGLVAGVSFATASSIPGGTNEEGKPTLEGKPAFDVFAISSLVGLCFSVTGLIMFLTILTSRKQAKDFRRDLPLKLLLGLSSLFVSIASMFVSFCTGHFFLLSHRYKTILYPIYAATCFPVTFYAVAQFPLYFDLLTAILTTVPWASDKGDKI